MLHNFIILTLAFIKLCEVGYPTSLIFFGKVATQAIEVRGEPEDDSK